MLLLFRPLITLTLLLWLLHLLPLVIPLILLQQLFYQFQPSLKPPPRQKKLLSLHQLFLALLKLQPLLLPLHPPFLGLLKLRPLL